MEEGDEGYIVRRCCVHDRLPKLMQHMHDNIAVMFEYLADPVVHLLLQKRSMAKASNLQKYLSKCLKCIKQWLSVNFFNPLQPTKSTLTDCLAYWSVRLCQLNLKQLSCSSLLVQNEVSSHFQFVSFLRYFFGFWSRPSGSFVLSMGSNPGTFYILST